MSAAFRSRALTALVVVVVLGVTGLHVWSLGRYPAPFIDEAWFGSRAWAYLQTGRAFGPLDSGAFERFRGHETFFPFFPTWLQAQALRIAGAPALLPLRALSLVAGAALLAAVYRIAGRAAGRGAGLAAVAFVALSNTFFVGAHFARPDVIASALGLWAIALGFPAPEHPSRSLAAGLLLGAAFEMHPHSVVLGLAVALLHVRSPRPWATVAALAAGCAVGLGVYLALHVLRHPREFLEWNRVAFGPTHTPPVLVGVVALGRSLRDLGALLIARAPVLAPIGLVALAVALRSREAAQSRLAACTVATLVGAVLLWRNKTPYYAIYVLPLVETGAALLLVRWARAAADSVAARAGAAVVLAGWLATVVLSLAQLRRDGRDDYEACTAKLRALVRPGDRILGVQTYWFALHDHPYRSWEQLVYLQRAAPGSSLEDAFRALRPDVFVVDAGLATFMTDARSPIAQRDQLRLPPAEVRGVLARHGAGEQAFECPRYGPFMVHRLAWGER